ncbi:MAG TPA: sigma 54-interacting transcriptional regulator [Clostridiales bacterium]|nr:sigma 54-interacting transcriptional regulator [Clostridiales bacterium]
MAKLESKNITNDLSKDIDFREVVDNLLDGVLVTNGEGTTLYVNPSYCRHSDIQPEEILGRSVFDIAREGVLFKHSVSADVIRSKRKVSGTGFMRTINGKNINGYASGVPLFDKDGNIRLVVSSVMDIDELKTRFDEFRNSSAENDAIQIYENFGGDSGRPLLGEDPAIIKIMRIIAMAAPTDVTILITGESGVGKEVVADRIQHLSKRRDKPYVKVNCTAIPANLLESELFGYEKGAFTGARSTGKAGLFEIANHGTILLDEIGDLPIELQTKLLRVLQEKEVIRLGGTKPISLDVRVIAATNANLRQKIQEGKFREDLFYRLSVIPIHIPPLRERKGDIIPIVKHYFNEYCKKHNRSLIMPESAYVSFESYDWPGNVRELQNVIEYIVICSEDQYFNVNKLAEILGLPSAENAQPVNLHDAVDRFEKQLIENALKHTGGVRKAASYLGVDPSTISRKMKKHGIRPPK